MKKRHRDPSYLSQHHFVFSAEIPIYDPQTVLFRPLPGISFALCSGLLGETSPSAPFDLHPSAIQRITLLSDNPSEEPSVCPWTPDNLPELLRGLHSNPLGPACWLLQKVVVQAHQLDLYFLDWLCPTCRVLVVLQPGAYRELEFEFVAPALPRRSLETTYRVTLQREAGNQPSATSFCGKLKSFFAALMKGKVLSSPRVQSRAIISADNGVHRNCYILSSESSLICSDPVECA